MNTFAQNINTAGSIQQAYTNNGALTNSTSGDPIVDFFFVAGASRTMSENAIVSLFARAYGANKEIALRMSLWTRDARGGAGERETFRRILRWIEMNHPEDLRLVVPRIPELGRWDDLFTLISPQGRELAVNMISAALKASNGLCAKWMPRKGEDAVWLRRALGMTPKQYRKTLVGLTNVVEQQMCANQWNEINIEHIPSVASSRYRKALKKHVPEKFVEFGEKVAKGEAKVNASAIFPYDVIKPLIGNYGMYYNHGTKPSQAEIQIANGQWNALPDFVGEGSFIPMIDCSGSMLSEVSKGTTALSVAVSLGLYLMERNKSAFKDVWLTFSDNANLQRVNGTLMDRLDQILTNKGNGLSTNVQAGFDAILDHAIKNKVPQSDMPKYLIIVSDMEFNSHSFRGNSVSNVSAARAKFRAVGYEVPNLVFWNVMGRAGNSPVTYREDGTALVSGFSPSITKSVLSATQLDPLTVALNTVMDDRYALAS